MSQVIVVSRSTAPRLRLSLVVSEDIARCEASCSCLPSEITRERTWRTIQSGYNRHVKGALYVTAAHMRWALDAGYCTSFVRQQFERLLQLQAHA